MINWLINKAKRNPRVKNMIKQHVTNHINTHISEITPFNPRSSKVQGRRLNLLVPSINEEHLFGGISTVLAFFEQLADKSGMDRRIILTDSYPHNYNKNKFSGYTISTAEEDSKESRLIVPFNDRYNKNIPIAKGDIFIASSWWTAYFAQRLVNWQAQTYQDHVKHLIYFIQDFEPGFYQWSSHYLLADSTYRYQGPQIAIFNTSLLRDFFHNHGYSFAEEYFFEPQMNEALKQILIKTDLKGKKKKKILLYGRPSVGRNAFPLIIESLRVWAGIYPEAVEWEVISAGESHPDVEIGNGIVVRSAGKLSLEEYANTLIESSVGLSLMASPHPSYPPLEMAHFGLLTLTNSYENKELSNWHDNITSIDNISPEGIALGLKELCEKYLNNVTIGLEWPHSKSYLANNYQENIVNKLLEFYSL